MSIKLRDFEIGSNKLTILAGPCAVESLDITISPGVIQVINLLVESTSLLIRFPNNQSFL